MMSDKEYGKCFSVEIDIEDIRINVMLDYIFSAGINEITGVAHEHANHEVYYVRRGTILLECEKNSYTLSEGDLFIIGAGTSHRVISHSTDAERKCLLFTLHGKCAKMAFPDMPHIVFSDGEKERLLPLINDIVDFSGEKIDAFGLYRLRASLGILFSCILEKQEIIRKHYFENRIDMISRSNMLKVCCIIEQFFADHYKEPVSIMELACHLGYSRSQTQRIIEEYYGMSFSEKLRETRMRVSRQMLMSGRTAITDIAEKCGYSSRQSFENAYIRYYGISPAKARALSAISGKYLKDAFIEKYIEGKILRDDESVNVYRMMRENMTYEISYNLDPSEKLTSLEYYRYFITKKSTDTASYWAKNSEKIINSYSGFLASVGQD